MACTGEVGLFWSILEEDLEVQKSDRLKGIGALVWGQDFVFTAGVIGKAEEKNGDWREGQSFFFFFTRFWRIWGDLLGISFPQKGDPGGQGEKKKKKNNFKKKNWG